MIDDKAAIFTAEYTIDYAVARVLRRHLVDQILLIVESDRAVFESDEYVIL